MRDKILQKLSELEQEKGIKILYAVESGSRAWGFESTDSDWDVRFIYMHKPEWYLSIDEKPDSIEIPIVPDAGCPPGNTLDFSGWDVRKALKLFRKSNPPLLEWLRSPIVYLEQTDFVRSLRALAGEFFSPKACMYHYLHMAQGNYREFLRGDYVQAKKYFYVLRPVFACLWIERAGTMAPMEFERLLDAYIEEGALKKAVKTLLDRKRCGEELASEPKIQVINDFLEAQINYFEIYLKTGTQLPKPDTGKLDVLFRDALRYFTGTLRDFNGTRRLFL